jgi:hypothetical protein
LHTPHPPQCQIVRANSLGCDVVIGLVGGGRAWALAARNVLMLRAEPFGSRGKHMRSARTRACRGRDLRIVVAALRPGASIFQELRS